MLATTPPRLLSVEGAYNLRDIGGYAAGPGHVTRWRTLFRSGSLHALGAHGRLALTELGLRSIIDLRTPDELAAEPNPFMGNTDLAYTHLPIITALRTEGPFAERQSAPRLNNFYRYVLDQRRDAIGAVVEHLAQPGALPALVHCTAGKDRTGLIIALLLSLANVPKYMIAADFSLSEPALAVAPAFAHHRQRLIASGHGHLLTAPPELISESLTYIEEAHGGVVHYLRACGLSEPTLQRLRTVLVEEIVR